MNTSTKKMQTMPYMDPRLEFKMGLALMGPENARLYLDWLHKEMEILVSNEHEAREHLEWISTNHETGELPAEKKEKIDLFLQEMFAQTDLSIRKHLLHQFVGSFK